MSSPPTDIDSSSKIKKTSQSPPSSTAEDSEGPTPSKRVYSKGGCRECKRRKIKCDEGKPQCWQCMRLRKDCTYPEAGEKVLRVSKKRQLQHEQLQAAQHVLHLQARTSSPTVINQVPKEQFYHTKHDLNQPVVYHAHQVMPGPSFYQTSPPQLQALQHPRNMQQQQQPFMYHQAALLNPQQQQQSPHPIQPITNAQHLPPMSQHTSVSSAPSLYTANPIPKPHTILPPPPSSQTKPNDEGANKAAKTSSLMSLLNDSQRNGTTNSNSYSPNEMMNYFKKDDLNLLAIDLNKMVNNIMYEMNSNYKNKYNWEENSGNIVNGDSVLSDNMLKNLPLEYIKLKKQKDKIYYEIFYNEFANIVLPFGSYDYENHNYCNPARDIILNCASIEDYVLAAVLANGAKMRFSKTKNDEDEEAHCLYLSKCLKLLGPAISPDDNKLSTNIENVLLTVLLLTTTNAANSKQDWRSHLKGAKDILLRNSTKNRKVSKILIFCKFWFITLEVLAGTSCKKGGTLLTDEEVTELINVGSEQERSVLKELGIILENGFNIMGGYHHDVLNLFGGLIKGLNGVRNGTINLESFDFIKLFSQFHHYMELEFIDKKGVNIEVKKGILVESPNETLTVSWMDVSHQSYVMASLITCLINFFKEDKTSPQIQLLSNSIIEFNSYLEDDTQTPPKFINRNAYMMLQWSMLTAGLNIKDERRQKIVTRFFEMSERVGSGGASIALNRLKRVWRTSINSEYESSDDDFSDYVSY